MRVALQRWQERLEYVIPRKPKVQIRLRNIGKSPNSCGSEVWSLNVRSSLLPFFDSERFRILRGATSCRISELRLDKHFYLQK